MKEEGDSRLIVVSLSIQPILSLAEKYNMSPDETAEKLVTLFKNLGADRVIEMSIAEDFSLLEAQQEFVERFRNNEGKKSLPMLASACPGNECYSRY